jgi:hypothetical protein
MRFRSPASARRWAPYLATTVLVGVLAGTATYWALQLFAPRVAIAPAGSLVDWQKAPDLGAASRLFGAPPSAGGPAEATPSNIRVLGVAASSLRATAILSIDGKPPIALMAGARIDDHARLLEVHPDAVVIEQAGSQIRLPAPKRPDIGVLSAGAAQAGPSSLASPVGITPATPSASRTPAMPAPAPGASPAPEPTPSPALGPTPSPAPAAAPPSAPAPAATESQVGASVPSEDSMQGVEGAIAPGQATPEGPDQTGEPGQAAEYAAPGTPAEPAGNLAVDRGPPEGASGIRGGTAQ